jgi:hypothetical protein
VHYFALAAMANGILHTAIGPHEGHMRRRDFVTQLGGGLRRAVPAPQTECAGASIVSARGATVTLEGELHSLPRRAIRRKASQ